MKRNKGFTAVEIMIVVAIIGLLAAIAIPSFIKARYESQKNACIENLGQIENAKEQWAAANNKKTGDVVDKIQVAKLIKAGAPECPAGGIYDYGKVGHEPTCGAKGHVLPAGYVKPVRKKSEEALGKKPTIEELRESLEKLEELSKALKEYVTTVEQSVKVLQETIKEKGGVLESPLPRN